MNEEILVRRMKEGDKASFDLLYEKYKNIALRTAYLITGSIPDSEDVVQDTFVKTYLHCKELKNDSGFKAWMMQILVRTAYKTGKRKGKEMPDEEIIAKADMRTERSSLDHVLVKEETRILSEAVHRLPIKQRTVVILFYYQEYSVREISRMLGLREGTVKSRLHVARERLRGILEQDMDTGAYMHNRILE